MTVFGDLCPRCKLEAPTSDISPGNLLLASNGCWAKYGEVLAREYSDPVCMSIHHLTVDAYFAQHVPADVTAATIACQNKHVIALYMNRCKGRDAAQLREIRATIAKKAPLTGRWIEPPSDLSLVNISTLLDVTDSANHIRLIDAWASAVWSCWEARLPEIEQLVAAYQC